MPTNAKNSVVTPKKPDERTDPEVEQVPPTSVAAVDTFAQNSTWPWINLESGGGHQRAVSSQTVFSGQQQSGTMPLPAASAGWMRLLLASAAAGFTVGDICPATAGGSRPFDEVNHRCHAT